MAKNNAIQFILGIISHRQSIYKGISMIYETDSSLDSDLQKIGCYALSIAHYRPEITSEEMNDAWGKAKICHYVDDDGTLTDPQSFVNILGYPLKIRLDKNGSSHYPKDKPVDPKESWIIGEWHNDATNFTHFVCMDGLGTDKSHVTYDPIQGGSRTVREGYLVSYRLFDKV